MSQAAAGNYRRRLSGVERYSLVINELCRYNVDGVVEGNGVLEEDAVRTAVALAAAANPGVRVRLTGWLGFSQWVDSGIPPAVRTVLAPAWDGCSELGTEFMQQRFDALGGGPIADVLIVRSKKTHLIFRGLHAAMDGRGMLHWQQEVFRALRGEPLQGSNSTLTDFDVAVRFREQLEATKKTINKSLPPAIYIPVVPPSEQREPGLDYMWRMLVLPKNISNILAQAAIFLAQYARRDGARADEADGVVGFTVPVDFRGLRVAADSTGNLTGYLRIQVSATDSSKNIMLQIGRQIRACVDCQTPLGANVLRWIPIGLLLKLLKRKAEPLLYAVNKDLPSGGLVSIGQLDTIDFCCPGFTAERNFGIPGSVGKLNVVMVNQPTATTVIFSAPKNYNREGQIDNLVRDFAAAFSV